MTRPPLQPRREDVAEPEREAYDAVITRVRTRLGQPAGAPDEHFDAGPYFGVMLTSPTLCHLASQMGAYLVTRGNYPGSYSHADREFAEQVLCATWKTNAGQNVHIADAVGAGVRLEAIQALRDGDEAQLNDDERLLTAYILQVVSGQASDGTYDAMEARLGTRGLFEYTGFILWLQWTIRMEQWVKLPSPTDSEVEELIAALRGGDSRGEDYASRIA
ncbi:MAG TPA: hypothetical protein VHV75_09740 [Solirubrobacteraceae bacterium]|jgi:hypothetical protein|nr:hypothetical protein [Solirubrobacteraceae bacterium]